MAMGFIIAPAVCPSRSGCRAAGAARGGQSQRPAAQTLCLGDSRDRHAPGMTIETAQFMLRPLLDHINAGIGIQEKVQHAIGSEGFTLPLLLQGSLRKEIVTRQRAIEKKRAPSGCGFWAQAIAAASAPPLTASRCIAAGESRCCAGSRQHWPGSDCPASRHLHSGSRPPPAG